MFSLDLSASRCGLLPQSLEDVNPRYDVRACINMGSGFLDLVRKVPYTSNVNVTRVKDTWGYRSSFGANVYNSVPSGVVNGAPISFLVVGQIAHGAYEGQQGISTSGGYYGAPRLFALGNVLEAKATVAGLTHVTITGPTLAVGENYAAIVRWRPGIGLSASFNGSAIQSSSNSQTSLYVSPNSLFYGGNAYNRIYLVASFGDVSDADMQALSANPSLLFRPSSSPVWFPSSTAAALAGSSLAEASATGALSTAIPFAGQAAAVVAASGVLTSQIQLTGTALAQAEASAALSSGIYLSGGAVSASFADGTLTTQISLDGSALAQSTVAGSLDSAIQLAGDAVAQADATGGLDGSAAALAGLAAGESIAAGDLTTLIQMAGNAAAEAAVAGVLDTLISLSGSASAQATAAGELASSGGFSYTLEQIADAVWAKVLP